jgi:hypothetical protein
MRARLEHAVTERAKHRTRQADVSAIRAQSPDAGDDRLASGLELGATPAAGNEDAHEAHPEHRERWPGLISTEHSGPMQPYGSVRAAIEAAVSTSS